MSGIRLGPHSSALSPVRSGQKRKYTEIVEESEVDAIARLNDYRGKYEREVKLRLARTDRKRLYAANRPSLRPGPSFSSFANNNSKRPRPAETEERSSRPEATPQPTATTIVGQHEPSLLKEQMDQHMSALLTEPSIPCIPSSLNIPSEPNPMNCTDIEVQDPDDDDDQPMAFYPSAQSINDMLTWLVYRILDEQQRDHVIRMANMLLHHLVVFDTSQTGCGKTHSSFGTGEQLYEMQDRIFDMDERMDGDDGGGANQDGTEPKGPIHMFIFSVKAVLPDFEKLARQLEAQAKAEGKTPRIRVIGLVNLELAILGKCYVIGEHGLECIDNPYMRIRQGPSIFDKDSATASGSSNPNQQQWFDDSLLLQDGEFQALLKSSIQSLNDTRSMSSLATSALAVAPISSITHHAKRFEWHLPKRTLVVFDEAHRARNKDSQAFQLLASLIHTYQHLPPRLAPVRLLLSSATLLERTELHIPVLMFFAGLIPTPSKALAQQILRDPRLRFNGKGTGSGMALGMSGIAYAMASKGLVTQHADALLLHHLFFQGAYPCAHGMKLTVTVECRARAQARAAQAKMAQATVVQDPQGQVKPQVKHGAKPLPKRQAAWPVDEESAEERVAKRRKAKVEEQSNSTVYSAANSMADSAVVRLGQVNQRKRLRDDDEDAAPLPPPSKPRIEELYISDDDEDVGQASQANIHTASQQSKTAGMTAQVSQSSSQASQSSSSQVASIAGMYHNEVRAVKYYMSDEHRLAIQHAAEELWKLVLIESTGNRLTSWQIVLMSKLRILTEYHKIDTFVELCEGALKAGLSCIVLLNFAQNRQLLQERLQARCGKITDKTVPELKIGTVCGGQKPTERQEYIRQFQDDSSRIILVMMQAGGVGISLHDLHGKHPRLVLISPPLSSTLLTQALGRGFRNGSASDALQILVLCKGTIEERIYSAQKLKLQSQDILNFGHVDARTENIFIDQPLECNLNRFSEVYRPQFGEFMQLTHGLAE